ncbi:hypothetical protein Tco_0373134 [Tanacetum coccineum]
MSKRGRDTKIPQSSGPLIKGCDEVVLKGLGDRMEKSATIAIYLEIRAGQWFGTTSKQSNDPPLSRGYTLRSGKDMMKLLNLLLVQKVYAAGLQLL